MSRLPALILIAAWLTFAALVPRLFSPEVTNALALAGMGLTVLVLIKSGRVMRPDPLSLSLTCRRPYWEMR